LHVLLTFIFISTSQLVHLGELAQSPPEGIDTMDIDTEIENTIKRVTVVTTLATSHPGPQFSTENLVDPGCLCKLGVYFPGVKQ